MSIKTPSIQNQNFYQSIYNNRFTWVNIFEKLMEIAVSAFSWSGFPNTIDTVYLERSLITTGKAVYFKDDVLNQELCLKCNEGGPYNVYGYPLTRIAYSDWNNYLYRCDSNDSIMIYNSMFRNAQILNIEKYAKQLFEIEMCIMINQNGQKTPLLIHGNEKQRLTLLNLYAKYTGNEPFIFGDKNFDPNETIKAINTQTPYLIDKLYIHKQNVFNEFLTDMGFCSINEQKRERVITSEIQSLNGGAYAMRLSRLQARQQAATQISEMFGHEITVKYNDYITDDISDYDVGGVI